MIILSLKEIGFILMVEQFLGAVHCSMYREASMEKSVCIVQAIMSHIIQLVGFAVEYLMTLTGIRLYVLILVSLKYRNYP